jgi:hypothetical protein
MTGVHISVRPASYRTIRGITSIAAICDEIAIWNDGGSSDFDAFVECTVGMIRSSPNWTRNSAIVITFDEGEKKAAAKSASAPANAGDAAAAKVEEDDNRVATVVIVSHPPSLKHLYD